MSESSEKDKSNELVYWGELSQSLVKKEQKSFGFMVEEVVSSKKKSRYDEDNALPQRKKRR